MIFRTLLDLQVCAGQSGGCEAAIHTMKDVFDDEETECILLMDAANAFKVFMKRKRTFGFF